VGLALLQLLFFLPTVAGGRALDLVSWPGARGSLFRVDSLSLLFGVTWTLALALVVAATSDRLRIGFTFLMTAGLLIVACAREPLVFYVGWEVAGLGLWLGIRTDRQLPIVVHASGLPLLFAVILSSFPPFAPPVGGVAQPWSLPVMLAMVGTVYIRSGCWPFDGWVRREGLIPLLGLYIVAAPYLLAKALVAGPWEPAGAWGLALLGTVGLAAGAVIRLIGREAEGLSAVSGLASIVIIGLGLATGSPLAAAGAIGVALASAFLVGVGDGAWLLLGAVPGVWMISQGALDLGYGVVVGVLLPVVVVWSVQEWAGSWAVPNSSRAPLHRLGSKTSKAALVIGLVIVLLGVVYPQVVVEGVLRPAVAAMAGGVGTPASLVSDWGVGLLIRSPQETLLAALPATGIALAVFLAWVALYWLKKLATRFSQ
jgi:hypothetical protein